MRRTGNLGFFNLKLGFIQISTGDDFPPRYAWNDRGKDDANDKEKNGSRTLGRGPHEERKHKSGMHLFKAIIY